MGYADPATQRAYVNRWMQDRRLAWLAGRSCAHCGSTSRLEVDHINPSEKVAHRVWSWALQRRLAELAKCQALCHDCHKRKSDDAMRKPAVCGTVHAYAKAGCRCTACRAANAERSRRQKHQRAFDRAASLFVAHIASRPQSPALRFPKGRARVGHVLERGSQPVLTVGGYAVRLDEACRRLGFSVRTGRRRLAEGTFPIPALERQGRAWHRFSSVEIDWYLSSNATASLERKQG